MMKNGLIALMMLALIGFSSIGDAKPLAELLEQAEFQEQSVGDLGAAIELYNQVIEKHDADKSIVAQAVYRQALCFEKLGNVAEAQAGFEQLLKLYPHQKDVVDLAKKALHKYPSQGLKLLALPWTDGELLRYEIFGLGGKYFGSFEMQTRKADQDGKQQWNLESYLSIPLNQVFQYSQVKVDGESFLTNESYLSNSQLGRFSASFQDNKITIESAEANGERTKKILEVNKDVYDYEQLVYIVRRLPIRKAYSVSLPLYVSASNSIVSADIRVVGEEKIVVPAGTFDTYKILVDYKNSRNPLPNQTFWLSKNDGRQIVKSETQGLYVDLQEIIQASTVTAKVIEKEANIEFSIPSGWRSMGGANLGNGIEGQTVFGPRMDGIVQFGARAMDTRILTLAMAVERDAEMLKGYFKRYSIRSGSMSSFVVNGLPARSYIADYGAMNQPMVEYRSYVLGPSGIYWFMLRADTHKFDSLKQGFESMVSSLSVPTDDSLAKPCNNPIYTNLLTNGDFSLGNNSWMKYQHLDISDASFSFDKVKQFAQINVRDGGENDWNVQLFQGGICLEYTKKYRLSFDYRLAEMGDGRSFSTSLQQSSGRYMNYSVPQTLTATSEPQKFSYEFMMTSESDNASRVIFNFGGSKIDEELTESQFIIDNVELIEL